MAKDFQQVYKLMSQNYNLVNEDKSQVTPEQFSERAKDKEKLGGIYDLLAQKVNLSNADGSKISRDQFINDYYSGDGAENKSDSKQENKSIQLDEITQEQYDAMPMETVDDVYKKSEARFRMSNVGKESWKRYNESSNKLWEQYLDQWKRTNGYFQANKQAATMDSEEEANKFMLNELNKAYAEQYKKDIKPFQDKYYAALNQQEGDQSLQDIYALYASGKDVGDYADSFKNYFTSGDVELNNKFYSKQQNLQIWMDNNLTDEEKRALKGETLKAPEEKSWIAKRFKEAARAENSMINDDVAHTESVKWKARESIAKYKKESGYDEVEKEWLKAATGKQESIIGRKKNEYAKRITELEKELGKHILRTPNGVPFVDKSGKAIEKELNTLKFIKDQYAKGMEIMNSPYHGDNAWNAFVSGIGNSLSDPDTWLGGLVGGTQYFSIVKPIIEKSRKGIELTDDEAAVLDSMIFLAETEGLRAGTQSNAYTGGGIAAQSIPFMLEFIMTGGIAEAITKPAVTGYAKHEARKYIIQQGKSITREKAEALLRKEGREITKESIEDAKDILMNRFAQKLAYGRIKHGKYELFRTGIDMAQTPVQMLAMPSFYGGMITNMSDKVGRTNKDGSVEYQDENGNYLFNEGDSFLKAYYKGWKEVVSEKASPLFDIPFGRMMNAIGRAKRGIKITNPTAHKISTYIGGMLSPRNGKITQYTGIGSIPSEINEEIFGSGMDAIAGIFDDEFAQSSKEFWTADNWESMLIGFSLMPLGRTVSSTVGVGVSGFRAHKATNMMNAFLINNGSTPEQASAFMDKLNNTSVYDLNKIISDYCIENNLTPREQREMMRTTQQYLAYNAAFNNYLNPEFDYQNYANQIDSQVKESAVRSDYVYNELGRYRALTYDNGKKNTNDLVLARTKDNQYVYITGGKLRFHAGTKKFDRANSGQTLSVSTVEGEQSTMDKNQIAEIIDVTPFDANQLISGIQKKFEDLGGYYGVIQDYQKQLEAQRQAIYDIAEQQFAARQAEEAQEPEPMQESEPEPAQVPEPEPTPVPEPEPLTEEEKAVLAEQEKQRAEATRKQAKIDEVMKSIPVDKTGAIDVKSMSSEQMFFYLMVKNGTQAAYKVATERIAELGKLIDEINKDTKLNAMHKEMTRSMMMDEIALLEQLIQDFIPEDIRLKTDTPLPEKTKEEIEAEKKAEKAAKKAAQEEERKRKAEERKRNKEKQKAKAEEAKRKAAEEAEKARVKAIEDTVAAATNEMKRLGISSDEASAYIRDLLNGDNTKSLKQFTDKFLFNKTSIVDALKVLNTIDANLNENFLRKNTLYRKNTPATFNVMQDSDILIGYKRTTSGFKWFACRKVGDELEWLDGQPISTKTKKGSRYALGSGIGVFDNKKKSFAWELMYDDKGKYIGARPVLVLNYGYLKGEIKSTEDIRQQNHMVMLADGTVVSSNTSNLRLEPREDAKGYVPTAEEKEAVKKEKENKKFAELLDGVTSAMDMFEKQPLTGVRLFDVIQYNSKMNRADIFSLEDADIKDDERLDKMTITDLQKQLGDFIDKWNAVMDKYNYDQFLSGNGASTLKVDKAKLKTKSGKKATTKMDILKSDAMADLLNAVKTINNWHQLENPKTEAVVKQENEANAKQKQNKPQNISLSEKIRVSLQPKQDKKIEGDTYQEKANYIKRFLKARGLEKVIVCSDLNELNIQLHTVLSSEVADATWNQLQAEGAKDGNIAGVHRNGQVFVVASGVITYSEVIRKTAHEIQHAYFRKHQSPVRILFSKHLNENRMKEIIREVAENDHYENKRAGDLENEFMSHIYEILSIAELNGADLKETLKSIDIKESSDISKILNNYEGTKRNYDGFANLARWEDTDGDASSNDGRKGNRDRNMADSRGTGRGRKKISGAVREAAEGVAGVGGEAEDGAEPSIIGQSQLGNPEFVQQLNDLQKKDTNTIGGPDVSVVAPVVNSVVKNEMTTEDNEEAQLSVVNKRTQEQVNQWLVKRRPELDADQRATVIDWLEQSFRDTNTQLSAGWWFANGNVRIDEDDEKIKQAVQIANNHNVQATRFSTPAEIMEAYVKPNEGIKPINPNTVSTLHKVEFDWLPNDMEVFDVEDSDESQDNMRQIINTHFGIEANPWCLLQGENGVVTEAARGYWNKYGGGYRVAFQNGKLVAFMSRTHGYEWWDRRDHSHKGIPHTKKLDGKKKQIEYLGSSNFGGASEKSPIFEGDPYEGHYIEYAEDGKTVVLEQTLHKGKLNGVLKINDLSGNTMYEIKAHTVETKIPASFNEETGEQIEPEKSVIDEIVDYISIPYFVDKIKNGVFTPQNTEEMEITHSPWGRGNQIYIYARNKYDEGYSIRIETDDVFHIGYVKYKETESDNEVSISYDTDGEFIRENLIDEAKEIRTTYDRYGKLKGISYYDFTSGYKQINTYEDGVIYVRKTERHGKKIVENFENGKPSTTDVYSTGDNTLHLQFDKNGMIEQRGKTFANDIGQKAEIEEYHHEDGSMSRMIKSFEDYSQVIADYSSDGKLINMYYVDGETGEVLALTPEEIIQRNFEFYDHVDDGGVQFSFIGKKGAEMLDSVEGVTYRMMDLNTADSMEREGMSQEKIRLATGWERGADGLWRYELVDGQLNEAKLQEIRDTKNYNTTLGEIYDCPELYKAYPMFANMHVEFYPFSSDSEKGERSADKLRINSGFLYGHIKEDNRGLYSLLGTIIHETQHEIQNIEGFDNGSNFTKAKIISEAIKKSWGDERIKELFNKYSLLYRTRISLQRLLEKYSSDVYGEGSKEWRSIHYIRNIDNITEIAKDLIEEAIVSNSNLSDEISTTVNTIEELNEESKEYYEVNDIFRIYEAAIGEVESRNADRRKDKNTAWRRANTLVSSEDVSRADQIMMQHVMQYIKDNSNRWGVYSGKAGNPLEHNDYVGVAPSDMLEVDNDVQLSMVADKKEEKIAENLRSSEKNSTFATVAPLYETDLPTQTLIEEARKRKSYEIYLRRGNMLAKMVGLRIKNLAEERGGYEFTKETDGMPPYVQEPSNTWVYGKTVKLEKIQLFSYLLGDLAPEQQESVIFGRYLNDKQQKFNAIEIDIPCIDADKAGAMLDRMRESFTIDKDNRIRILVFSPSYDDITKEEYEELKNSAIEKYITLKEELEKDNNYGTGETFITSTVSRLADAEARRDFYTTWLGQASFKDERGRIRPLVEAALRRVESAISRGESNTDLTPVPELGEIEDDVQLSVVAPIRHITTDPFAESPEGERFDEETRDKLSKKEKEDPKNDLSFKQMQHYASLVYKAILITNDRTEDLRRLQNEIDDFRRSIGKRPMPPKFNVRGAVEQNNSARSNRVRALDKVVEKLTDTIAKMSKILEEKGYTKEGAFKDNVSFDALTLIERYLIAKDDIERYEKDKNPRGAVAFLESMDIPMNQYERLFADIFKDNQRLLIDLWGYINQITDTSLEEAHNSGLISDQSYREYKEREFYVPEKGFDRSQMSDIEIAAYDNIRSNYHHRLKSSGFSYEAKGGESLADNVIAYMIYDAKDSIAKAVENRTKQLMARLLEENPEWLSSVGMPQPYRVWYVKDASGEYVKTTERPSESMFDETRRIQDEIDKLKKARKGKTETEKELIDSEIDRLEKTKPIASSHIVKAKENEALYKMRSNSQKAASTVSYYKNGELYQMDFGPRIDIANALNNVRDTSWTGGMANTIGGYLAALYTTYNYEFAPVNVVRDVPLACFKGTVKYGPLFDIYFSREMLNTGNMYQISRWISGSKTDSSGENGRLFEQFLLSGASTGMSQQEDVAKIREKIKGAHDYREILLDKIIGLGGSASFLAEFTELWTRYAIFKASYSFNKTFKPKWDEEDLIAEAAKDAKNLGVNLDRKGFGSKWYNIFMQLSIFATPVIQGAAGFFRSFDKKENAIGKAMFWLVIVPAIAGFIMTSATLSPDDDDKEHKIPDYEYDNYLQFGKAHFQLNEELRPSYLIGVNMALLMNKRRTWNDVIYSMTKAFVTNWMAIAPKLQDAASQKIDQIFDKDDRSNIEILTRMLTPEALEQMFNLTTDENSFGQTLKAYNYGDMPQYELGNGNNPLTEFISYMLYLTGGGSKNAPSVWKYGKEEKIDYDWNPKEVEQYMRYLPTGDMKLLSSLFGLGEAAVTGNWEDFNKRLIPFESRFIRNDDVSIYRRSKINPAKDMYMNFTSKYTSLAHDIMELKSLQDETEFDSKEYKDYDVRIQNIEKELEFMEQKFPNGKDDVRVLGKYLNEYNANNIYYISRLRKMGLEDTKKLYSEDELQEMDYNEREAVIHVRTKYDEIMEYRKANGYE